MGTRSSKPRVPDQVISVDYATGEPTRVPQRQRRQKSEPRRHDPPNTTTSNKKTSPSSPGLSSTSPTVSSSHDDSVHVNEEESRRHQRAKQQSTILQRVVTAPRPEAAIAAAPATSNALQASSLSTKSSDNRNVRFSNTSSGSNTTSSSYRIDGLRSKMMRRHFRRDPMEFYEVLNYLGEGSFGSVARVRKRSSAVGGSAREDFVLRNRGCLRVQCCDALPFLRGHRPESAWIPAANDNDNSINATGIGGGDDNDASSWRRPRKQSSDDYQRAKSNQSSQSHSSSILHASDINGRSVTKKGSTMIKYGGKKEIVYALKALKLDRCMNSHYKDALRKEVNILRSLDHPNVVRAIESFDYKEQMVIILELCSGGDLYQRDPYSESAAHDVIRSLVSAVAYLHSKGICHRDLKFENIMFVSHRSTDIKIIDFGLSQKFVKDQHLHDAVGTVYTMAPELIKGKYDERCDVWSLGVICYMLLTSQMPFYGKDRKNVIKKIVHGKYKFVGHRWRKVSEEAKQFIQWLLTYNPAKRPTADEVAMQSSWLNREFSFHREMEVDAMDRVQATMHAFKSYPLIKKLALMVVAYKSTAEEIGYLREMFRRFDMSHTGELSRKDLEGALTELYVYSPAEVEELYNGLDVDGTGRIHYLEFLAATVEAHGSIDEARLAEAFDRLDSDDSGYITVANLREFVGDEMPHEYLIDAIAEADITLDRRISYDEFLALWDDEGDEKLEACLSFVVGKHKYADGMSAKEITSELEGNFGGGGDNDDSPCSRSSDSSSDDMTGSQFYQNIKRELSRRGLWV